MNPRLARSRRPAPPARGFTLIETSMALVIIGVGVLAYVDANKAFIEQNSWSSHAATATFLANEVRELTRAAPRHDPVTGLFLDGSVLHGWGMETGEVTIDDLDDIDDLDGLRFGADGDFPGPINAFGQLVPRTSPDGSVPTDGEGNPLPLEGWYQQVYVEKVDPFNSSLVRADNYEQPAAGQFGGLTVDRFPLRVTVIVEYQGTFDTSPREVSRLVWVVP